jgi:hypothetical protein
MQAARLIAKQRVPVASEMLEMQFNQPRVLEIRGEVVFGQGRMAA